MSHSRFIDNHTVCFQRFFTECCCHHSHRIFPIDFHHIVGKYNSHKFNILSVSAQQFLQVYFILQIVVWFPVPPYHCSIQNFCWLQNCRKKSNRTLSIYKEIPCVMRRHMRNKISNLRKWLSIFSRSDWSHFKLFCFIWFLTNCKFCQINIDCQ